MRRSVSACDRSLAARSVCRRVCSRLRREVDAALPPEATLVRELRIDSVHALEVASGSSLW